MPSFLSKSTWICLSLLLIVLLSACNTSLGAQLGDLSERPIRAVATTGMIGDLVRNIGGERVDLTVLMGPGIDPHLYKASEGDVIKLGEADVLFYNGQHLEAGLSRVLERMSETRLVVAVSQTIEPSVLIAPPEFKGNNDPHIWLDVGLWITAAGQVRDTLTSMDPIHAEIYTRNARAYLAELDALDQYVRDQAARLPAEKRVLITAHDAFNYFGKAYGFEVRGLQGISTSSEASTLDVQELAEFIAARQIPAVFVESSVPQRTIQAVQAAVQARGYDVRLGGELYSDAMGSAGTPEGTYIGMVKHNIDTIVGALLGE